MIQWEEIQVPGVDLVMQRTRTPEGWLVVTGYPPAAVVDMAEVHAYPSSSLVYVPDADHAWGSPNPYGLVEDPESPEAVEGTGFEDEKDALLADVRLVVAPREPRGDDDPAAVTEPELPAIDGPGAFARAEAAESERDELRLVLLAEQGDPAGAPSEGWTYDGPLGQWLHGGISVRRLGRTTWLRTPEGARACWWWDVPGVADGHTPTAREAMRAADAAVEGEQG